MIDRFLIILFTVLGLTIACGTGAVLIAFGSPSPPPLVERAYNMLAEMCGMGAGVIFGLLGGHMIDAHRRRSR